MSLLDRYLPEPEFIVRDPDAVTREMIAQYEQLTDKTLYPAQVERVFIDVMAYREMLVREGIQDAGKLGLVRYSRPPILDMLGENVGVARLEAKPATTLVRLTFNPAPTQARVIPAYASVTVGGLSFETHVSVTVPAGAAYFDIEVFCTTLGTVGNGFAVGQIRTLSEGIEGLSVVAVSNITATSAGANEEEDDHLRERIVTAPEQFTNAGSEGAYRFFAMSAHQDIVAVAVRGAETSVVNGELVSTNGVPLGCVYVYPLTAQGLPSAAIQSAVYQACSKSKRRPITDHVVVFAPVAFNYRIVARITPYKTADSALAETAAEQSARDFVQDKSAQLGVDVVRAQIISAIERSYGVKDVELIEPAANKVLASHEWANCTLIDVSLKASEDV